MPGDPNQSLYFNEVVSEILKKINKIRHLKHNKVFSYKGKPL